MKLLIISTLIFVSGIAQAAGLKIDGQNLNIQIKDGDVEVSLPAEAREALNKWNSQFNIFSQKDYSASVLELFEDNDVPMAFIGDLEGQGKKSIVLLGQDTSTQYVVALVNKGKSWKAVEIYSWNIPDVKKSEIPKINKKSTIQEVGVPFYISEAEGDHAKKLKNKTGIQIETYLGNSEVYQIKKDKPVKVTL